MQVFGVAGTCLCKGQHGAFLLRVHSAGVLKLSVMHWRGVKAKKLVYLQNCVANRLVVANNPVHQTAGQEYQQYIYYF